MNLFYSRADSGRSLNDIEASLPQEAEAKEAAVDEAILERAGKFLAAHTIELSVPEDVSRSFDECKLRPSDSYLSTIDSVKTARFSHLSQHYRTGNFN